MLQRNPIGAMMKMKRGDPGLPRRKVCVRAVHHLFRPNLPLLGDAESKDKSPP
jgi:hypothetical protein